METGMGKNDSAPDTKSAAHQMKELTGLEFVA